MRRTLSLPWSGELVNTCAAAPPDGVSGGKYGSPCSTLVRVLSQLSMKAACIWATAGPSIR